MDFDLLSDILSDRSPGLTGNLLQNLPDRSLTQNIQDPSPEGEDGRLQISAPSVNARNPIQAGAVISKIEDIFESISDGILQEKHEVVISLKTRRKPRKQNIRAQNGPAKEQNEVRFPSRSPQEAWKFSEFRGHTALTSAHRLSRLAQNPRDFTRGFGRGYCYYKKVLSTISLRHAVFCIHCFCSSFYQILQILILSSSVALGFCLLLTSCHRDIYYRDPELFMKQEVVDRYLGDLAYTMGVERDALNVVCTRVLLVVTNPYQVPGCCCQRLGCRILRGQEEGQLSY